MYRPNQDVMNGQEFDWALIHDLPELPPRDVVQEVTPWRNALSRVLWGLALCSITFQFLKLQYILPAVGVLLMLLGLRTLRRENGWLRAGFVFAALYTALRFFDLFLNTTIYRLSSQLSWLLLLLGSLAMLGICFCLWRGLRAVFKKAGQPPKAGAAGALLLWYLLLYGLALLQYSGWLLSIVWLIVFICLLVSLKKLSKTMDEVGYAIEPAALRVSDRGLVLGLLGLLLVGGLCGYLFGGRYAMDWQPVDAAEHSQVVELKAQLAELGFPEDVLADLTAEDIASCAGAQDVVYDTYESSFEGTDEALRVTGVAVHLAGERERWVIFHHFLWLQEPDFHGADVFEIQPTSYLAEGWSLEKTLGGRVLCERNGVRYAASYASLGCESYVTTGFFASARSDIFATLSPPKHGEAFRGYVSYTVSQLRDDWVIDSWATYSHQESWLQYPVYSAKEISMQSGWSQGVFARVQSALQFYPTENGIHMFR